MKRIVKDSQLSILGDKLIDIILQRKDVFNSFHIVFPNSKLEQWFKTYWLKKHDEILMNCNFYNINDALLSFVDNEKKYKLLNKETLKSLIIKFLLNKEIQYPDIIKNYLYENDGELSPIKIYDIANDLSKLFIEYEEDCFSLDGWQKQLYDIVLEEANNHNLSTLSKIYDNITINKNNKIYYFFGFVNFNKLQEKIIDKYQKENDVYLYLLNEENNLNNDYVITSAPSKMREIESVHSKICDLLKDKSNNYSDFLIIAPNISEYESEISRVFTQDNINFPSIPYTISDKRKIKTNIYEGLKKLFEISNKNFCTRLDFYNLINNEDIMASRGITQEDIDTWMNSIISMNVFRDRENFDDWDYCKKRILLSKIANINHIDSNIVEISNEKYLPYSSIGLSDQSIVKFIKFIDDLKAWKNLLNSIKYINNENLLLIKEEFAKWFSFKDNFGFEANKYYIKALNIINTWYFMNVSDNNIPLNTLFYFLFDTLNVNKVKVGDCFVKGITFLSFDPNVVLSSKYIFFLNMGAKEIPTPIIKSELDMREYDISNQEQIKKVFFLQYFNATEKFYISYLNRNLKTDEELFESSLVIDLKSKFEGLEEKVSLDETRSWDQLYTKKEYKNKDYFLGLLSKQESQDCENKITYNRVLSKSFKVKNLADFLQEPLKYKFSILFGNKDEFDENVRDEFEPFDINPIDKYLLSKKIIMEGLINVNSDIINDENLIQRFNLEHKLPNINKSINVEAFKSILQESKKVIDYIKELDHDYEIIKLDDLLLGDDNHKWILTCNREICRLINGINRTYLEMATFKDKNKDKYFLHLYVASLMDVASLDEKDYFITLIRGAGITKEYHVRPSKARELLQRIYLSMEDYTQNVLIPINLIESSKINSLDDLIDNLKNMENPWCYFDDKRMFNYESQLGYNADNFIDQFNEFRKKHIELIIYLNNAFEGEGDNNEKV